MTSEIKNANLDQHCAPAKIFGDAYKGELNLYGDQKWTVWENIEYTDPQKNNNTSYDDKLLKVAWFSDMISFH